MIPGSNVLLVGPSGSGKTHSIGTLIDANITPFVVFTEPGMRTLAPLFKAGKGHYKYIKPATADWKVLEDNANKLNTMTFKGLTQLSDMNKTKYRQWLDLLITMNDFVCDCCGKSWGDTATWQTDRAICIDSLSGLNLMAMDLIVGAKPVKNQGDWGIAMGNLENFINKMTSDTQCHFVMTAHLEREKDEITGGIKLMVSSLGQKLPPKIPRFFDDVVLCQNLEGQFSWATVSSMVDLKYRNLGPGKELPPTFKLVIDSWVEAGGEIKPTEIKEPSNE